MPSLSPSRARSSLSAELDHSDLDLDRWLRDARQDDVDAPSGELSSLLIYLSILKNNRLECLSQFQSDRVSVQNTCEAIVERMRSLIMTRRPGGVGRTENLAVDDRDELMAPQNCLERIKTLLSGIIDSACAQRDIPAAREDTANTQAEQELLRTEIRQFCLQNAAAYLALSRFLVANTPNTSSERNARVESETTSANFPYYKYASSSSLTPGATPLVDGSPKGTDGATLAQPAPSGSLSPSGHSRPILPNADDASTTPNPASSTNKMELIKCCTNTITEENLGRFEKLKDALTPYYEHPIRTYCRNPEEVNTWVDNFSNAHKQRKRIRYLGWAAHYEQIGTSIGIFFGYVCWFVVDQYLGGAKRSPETRWKIQSALPLITTIPLIFTAYMVPESYIYLLKARKYKKAMESAQAYAPGKIKGYANMITSHFQMISETKDRNKLCLLPDTDTNSDLSVESHDSNNEGRIKAVQRLMKKVTRAISDFRKESLVSSTTEPLCITDAVLANTYHRFTCSHRRHGSNVPGPLEARRRAAKRKNTSWAQLRTHNPIEPALLFGQQNQAEWWQSPEKQDNAVLNPTGTPTPTLLDWLLPPESPRPPSTLFDHSHYGHLPPRPLPAPVPQTFDEQSFRACIRHCKHVHEMREAVGNLGIDHDHKSAATEVVLAHLLTFDSPAREIADFLTEPSFNPPCTDHHLNLLLRLKPNQDPGLRDEGEGDGNLVRLRAYFMVPNNWRKLHEALCRAAQLGLIRPVSFQHAMDHLYGYPDASAEERPRESLHREAGELLANFKESRLFELRDLSQLWVSAFVDKVLSEPLTAASWKLLLAFRDEDEVLSIIKDSRLPPITTSGLDEAVAFLQSLSQSRLSEARESMQRRPLAPSSAQVLSRLLPERDFVRWIKHTFIRGVQKEIWADQDVLIQTLPDRILAHLLASVTEEILVKTWSGECGPEVMYGWGKVISSLDRISFKQWLLDQSNFNRMCSTLSYRLGQQEQFLVGVWILVKLCWSRARATSISEQLSLREAFDQLFPTMLRAFNFGPEQLKLFTQSLPFEGTFVKKLSLLLNREHLSELIARVDVGEGKQGTEVAVSNLMDDSLYRQLQASSINGLSELGESINADLSTFVQISQKLIHGDKYAIRVVKRLLQHNLPIKTSLSQSAQQRMQG
ncbi:hypothetical protein DV736_g1478, partial [Chaetothyriales sp. CBS 134916]